MYIVLLWLLDVLSLGFACFGCIVCIIYMVASCS